MKKIQIQIDTGKQGPAPQGAVDMHSFAPVALWRGEPCKLAIGLFADADTVADVSGVTEVKLEVSARADHASPDFTQTIDHLDAGWDGSMTKIAWDAGTAQHALFDVGLGDVAPPMDGAEVRSMWLRVTMLDAGDWVVLCNGAVTVHEAGSWPV